MIAPVTDCQGFGKRLPGASLLLLLPALLFALNPELFELRWPSGTGAEVWRLVTGHWTHWSTAHLTWNLASFLLLAAACELDRACGRRRMLAAIACAALDIPAALWLALPEMSRYRGLSGIVSALFTLLAITLLRDGLATGHRARTLVGAAALTAFGSKIVFELVTGDLLFVQPTAGEVPFVPIPLAHAVGGFCGLVIGAISFRRTEHWCPGSERTACSPGCNKCAPHQ